MESQQDYFGQVRRVLWVVLALNWGVAVVKMVVGYLIHSTSMLADGFHSLSDGTSNIIGLVGLGLAAQPVDEDHPYGHGKYETLTSLAMGGLLFFLAIKVVQQAIQRLLHPVVPTVSPLSLAVMVATMVINLVVVWYELSKGKSLKSEILIADSYHTRVDIMITAAVCLALLGVKWGYPLIDPLASLVIAIFILRAAWEIFSQSSAVLCDRAVVDRELVKAVAMEIEGVMACHQIRSRGRGDDLKLDLHVLVDPNLSITDAHRISHEVEEALRRKIKNLTDVIVHAEPFGGVERD